MKTANFQNLIQLITGRDFSIKTDDLELFRELLYAHLMTINKVELAKKAGLGRRTLYDLVDPKKAFNPELATISALIQALAA